MTTSQTVMTDRIRVHGVTLNRQGNIYLPSKHKLQNEAPWLIEKMFGRNIWILRPKEGASVYFSSLKQALLVAIDPTYKESK